MAVSFTLTPSKLVKKAKDKGYKFLSDNLLTPIIQNGLPEKTFMLGDNNWNGAQPWMIKISRKNFNIFFLINVFNILSRFETY